MSSIRPKLILPIVLIFLAEGLIFFHNFQAAVVVHVVNLLYLALSSAVEEDRAYQALLLLPTFRLLNIAMPVFFTLTLYSYAMIYAPMLIPIYLIYRDKRFSSAEIGLNSTAYSFYIPLAILIGILVGFGEYFIIRPQMLTPDMSWKSFLLLASIQIFFVGLVEEFIFRSALQTVFEGLLGNWKGLLIASVIFGMMHSGYGMAMELVYVSLGGLAFGFLFQKCRNLPVISLAHGVTNISLFMLVPAKSIFLIPISIFLIAFTALAYLKNTRQGALSA